MNIYLYLTVTFVAVCVGFFMGVMHRFLDGKAEYYKGKRDAYREILNGSQVRIGKDQYQYQCQSYIDDNGVQDCTCGRCGK